MGIMAVHIGAVLLHRVIGGGRSVHLLAGGGADETGGPGRRVIILTGGWADAIVLPAAGGRHLGVQRLQLGAEVLGHVLGGGAAVDEGVHDGGEDAEGVRRGFRRLQVESRRCIAGRRRQHSCWA